jgi:transcriptional regulator with XRE-family HTH domain
MPTKSQRTQSSPIHRRVCGLIRAKRLELGLTQEDCADRLNVKPPRWNEIENGRFEPRLTLIERIAKRVFRCDVDELLVEREIAAAG